MGLLATFARRCIGPAAAICAAFAGAAAQQDPAGLANPRPFLWRIDGEVPSYLFGTIHLPDARVTDLHPEVERALAASDAVYTELEMDQVLSPELLAAMQLPDQKRLGDVAPAQLVQRVRRRLDIGDGVASPLLAMRPWVLSMQVMLHRRTGAGEPLDVRIYKDAKSAGKEVGGLETIEEQIAAFGHLGLDREIELLATSLDAIEDHERRGLDLGEQMIRAYCAGDARRLLSFFDGMNGPGSAWAELSRTLLTDRNLRMAERIDRHLHGRPDRSFTFAVGAGHLIGEVSIVDLLRARGYTVTRVPASIANIDDEIERLEREIEQRRDRIRELHRQRREGTAPVRRAG